jgi:RNA polymerase sigma factor (sigma-70 family)
MNNGKASVFVVDDDTSVREALSNLLESVGLHAQTFASTEEFMAAPRAESPSCLVLDVMLPGTRGLEFQEILKQAGISIPIIFVTAHGDIPMTSKAMKAGAIEFLPKPISKEELLAAIHRGIKLDGVRRQERAEMAALESCFAQLTPREREVMNLVVTGMINKQIAGQLGISEVTVKIHRRQAMEKMKAESLADLVRMHDKIKSGVRN